MLCRHFVGAVFGFLRNKTVGPYVLDGFGMRIFIKIIFCKVFEILKNFFQKVLKWGAGQAPQKEFYE